jgi:hypothetical protein
MQFTLANPPPSQEGRTRMSGALPLQSWAFTGLSYSHRG